MTKEELIAHFEYEKATSTFNFFIAIFVLWLSLLIIKSQISQTIIKYGTILFLVGLPLYFVRVSYYEDIYYSYIINYAKNNEETKFYKKIKEEKNNCKRFFRSFWGFKCSNRIIKFILSLFILFIIGSIWKI